LIKALRRPPKFRRILAVTIAVVLAALASWSFFIEPNRLVLHSEVITLPQWPTKLNGLKIAALGDIHAGSPFIDEAKMRQIVTLTNRQQPDVIVLLGDYMVTSKFIRHQIAPEVIAGILKDLQAPLGVYAVLGNHDWWFDGKRVRKAFETVGIRVLENEVVEVRKGEQSLWFAGFADAWTRPLDIRGTLAQVPDGATVIALAHNPDSFAQLPASVSLMLAAHTHGGQVNLPLVGRLVVPSNYGQRYAAGHIVENGRHLFVTTGIGTSILPVRFRVPPEVVLLTLNSP
jgi:uncharacterized protein